MSKPETTKPKVTAIARDEAYENIRVLARVLSDGMKTSPGGDSYTFKGSMNDVDDLRDALDHFDWNIRCDYDED